MIKPVRVKEIITKMRDYTESFDVVQKYETIDAMFGMDCMMITDKEIKALKDGKCLYFNNGEYAQIISYDRAESEEL